MKQLSTFWCPFFHHHYNFTTATPTAFVITGTSDSFFSSARFLYFTFFPLFFALNLKFYCNLKEKRKEIHTWVQNTLQFGSQENSTGLSAKQLFPPTAFFPKLLIISTDSWYWSAGELLSWILQEPRSCYIHIYCCNKEIPGHVELRLGENPGVHSPSLPLPVEHVVFLVPGVSWVGIRESVMCSPKPFSCAWHYFLHNNLEIHLCEDKNEPVLESKSLSHGHCVLTLEDVSCCLSLQPTQCSYRDSPGAQVTCLPCAIAQREPTEKDL